MMENLTSTSLLEALEDCDKHPGLEIGIACSSVKSVRDITDSFYSEMSGNRMPGWRIAHSARLMPGRATLEQSGTAFSDGSYIIVFNASDQEVCYGLSFHRVLFEDGIDERTLQRLTGRERMRGYPVIESTSTEALDDFLTSFKIV